MIFYFGFLFSIPEPTPSTMTALHQFGAEMLKLSRGLDAVSSFVISTSSTSTNANTTQGELAVRRPLLSKNVQALAQERHK